MRRRRPLEKLHQKPLRLVVALAPTARSIFRRKSHELFSAEAAAEVDERVGFVFPVAVFGAFVGEIGGGGGVEGRAGCGLEFDDEDFEDFEGRGDNGVLVGVYGGMLVIWFLLCSLSYVTQDGAWA